jgi:hypothetical protein
VYRGRAIHPSAWKGFSAKSISSKLHTPVPLRADNGIFHFSFSASCSCWLAETGYIIPVLAVEESVVRCEIRTAAAKLFAGVDAWSGDVYNPLTIIELKPVALACHAWVK